MALTPIQQEVFDDYIMDLVKAGKFADKSHREMAGELLAMEEDGEKVFINPETEALYNERTLRGKITKFINNAQSNAYANEIKRNYMQEAFKASKNMADKPATLKVIGEKFLPDKKDETDGNKTSPVVIAILDRKRMAITDGSGAVTVIEGIGDSGHERPDTMHIVADRRGEDTPLKALPLADDPTVHGLYKGEHTSEGASVLDTEVPPQDTDNNDSGSHLDTSE